MSENAVANRVMGVLGFAPARLLGFVPVYWLKYADSRLAEILGHGVRVSPGPVHGRILDRAKVTAAAGRQPLWEGYGEQTATRTPDQVKTRPEMGLVYTRLVEQLRPDIVVEFGTAFGMSGMYWLAGLEGNGRGHLYTFDPNQVWAGLARENLLAISDRFTLTIGTFEDNAGILPGPIDIAFIDAIHTSEFVNPQFDLVVSRSHPGTVIVLDDISFSRDMRSCWKAIAADPRVKVAAMLGRRVGMIEVA